MSQAERNARIQAAIDAFMKKNGPKVPTNKRNKKPEKQVVQALLVWLKSQEFDCHVVESKAVYSATAGRYLRGQTDAGVSDIIGCTPQGIACFVEAKAPGRINNLSMQQYVFLSEKAKKGCFAVCVDSVDRLKTVYEHWVKAREKNLELGNQYLLGLLRKTE